MRMGRRRGRLWLPAYVLLYAAFLYLPVLLLPVFSVNTRALPQFPLGGLTLKWYAELIRTPALLDAAWDSLRVGLAAALISTVFGICAARAFTRHRFRGQRVAGGLIMAPLVLPEIIVAASLLVVLLRLGLQPSLLAVTLGHALVSIPYSVTVLSSGFTGFDRSLEEASADLGETAWGTFSRVTLPLVAPAILSSLLVSFTVSLDEFVLAFFLSGREATLPIYLWGQLRFPGKLPGALAVGTLMLGGSVLLLSLAELFRRRAGRFGGGLA